jgi:soluble lytic murein transglycosylase-like protein
MPTPPPADLAAAIVRAHGSAASAYAEQKVLLRLSDDPKLAARVIRLLPPRVARDVTDDVLAHRELARLTPARPLSAFRVGHAAPARKLRAWYAEAQRRSGIAWQTLAAINYVESDFGRMREASVAGAQGPMQFMPSTWAAYGRGDIHDPHQAVLAAARFLRAARGSLYRYNPSWAYVDAVRRYAGRIRRNPGAFRVFYARRLVVRTPGGYRRLT